MRTRKFMPLERNTFHLNQYQECDIGDSGDIFIKFTAFDIKDKTEKQLQLIVNSKTFFSTVQGVKNKVRKIDKPEQRIKLDASRLEKL